MEFWAIAAVGLYAILSRIMLCYTVAFRTIHQFVNLSKVMVIQALLDVVIILPVIYFFSFYGLLVGFGIAASLKLLWFDQVRRGHRLFPIGWHFNRDRLKELLSVGFPIMVGNYFWKVFVTLDSLFVVWIMGTTSLAYYTVGAAMLIQLSEIPTNVSTVMTPRLFEKFGRHSNIDSLKSDLRKFFSGTLLCIAPVLCTVGFFGIPFMVRHLIPEFSEGIVVVQVLVFALFLVPQTHVPNQILVLFKKRVEYSLLIIVGIVSVIPCVGQPLRDR
jgi:O-antigen/teichoic acid export membrane protein